MIDAERLMIGLREAADEADPGFPGPLGADPQVEYRRRVFCRGLARAFRLIAAAVEDGDYDVQPVARSAPGAVSRIRRVVRGGDPDA